MLDETREVADSDPSSPLAMSRPGLTPRTAAASGESPGDGTTGSNGMHAADRESGTTPSSPETTSPHTAKTPEPVALVVGSQEYVRKNERRFALIQKKVRGNLEAQEEAEFGRLQAEILSATRETFPRPALDPEAWKRAKEGDGGRHDSDE